jgi:hypothetical protein
MLISSLQDLADASAFERSALATIFPLISTSTAQRAGLDLRTNTANIAAHSFVNSRGRDELIRDLRPLVFGAAWKVLDLAIEYGLNQTHPKPNRTIAAKATDAAQAAAGPFLQDQHAWRYVAAVYSRTVEQRHCVVHRSFVFSPAGDMSSMVDRASNPVPDLTVNEQDALCRLAQRVAMVIMANQWTPRERMDLVASLDALVAHHGLPRIGGGAPATLPLLIQIDASQTALGWVVDTARASQAAQQAFPGRIYFNIMIHFPNAGIAPLVGRLEQAPQGSAESIDPTSPPNWIDP